MRPPVRHRGYLNRFPTLLSYPRATEGPFTRIVWPDPVGPETVLSEAWAECKEHYEHETLLEEVFPLEDYGQVLSLLYLPWE